MKDYFSTFLTSILIFCIVLGSFMSILETSEVANAQTSEIIVNGGFETADLTGWNIGGTGYITESDAHTGKYCVALEGLPTTLSQWFEPPVYPPGDLTFWCKGTGGSYGMWWVVIRYNDGTNETHTLGDPPIAWGSLSVEIDTTRLLNQIDIITGEQNAGHPMLVDDFSVRAAWTPPSFVRDLNGYFQWMKDIPSAISARIELSDNIVDPEIVFGERVFVLGELEDPAHDGWILLEVYTASETLHYELQIRAHSRGDCWPMRGRDPSNAGFSVSTAPTNNSTRWNYTTGSTIQYSPAIANGMVFIGSSSDIRALNVTTSSLLWTFTRTVTSSPAVANGVVFFGASDGLYALNETNGVPVWRYQTSAPVNSSPVVVDGRVFFGCDDSVVYALNETNKNVLWSYTADSMVRTSPCVAYDKIFVGSQNYMYALNETTGVQMWNYTRSVQSSPTFGKGRVIFGASDGLYALNHTTGALMWKFATSAAVQSSPAFGNGRVFFGCNDLKVYALNETNGNELWSVMGEAAVTSSPAIAEDRVVFGQPYTKGDIRSQLTGELLWSFLASAPILSSPALAYGNLFLGDTNGNLYCIGPQFDVATNAVVTSKTVVAQGYSVSINVTAQNKGEVTETFYVSALHGGMIDEVPVTLPPDSADVVSIHWNTASAAMGNYSISGYAESVPGETSTSDNLLAGGWVVVTIPGDVQGDFVVDIYDAILLAGTFNSVPSSTNWNPNTDINDDSAVDIYDAIILAGHFNQHYP
jgi:outer membrane protein assembly factor BamB